MTYDEIIKKAGKRIKKHVYYIKDGVTTRLSDESVERVKFDLQTPLIGTSMQTCEIELKEKIDGEIYVEVEAKYGSSIATRTYGPYNLKEEPTYEANKKTYIHKVGDNLIKSMVDYEPVNLTYPATIFAFFTKVIEKVGYTTNIASLPNGNQQMLIDIFNNIGFTYRDVLDDIAVANGVLFYIDENEIKIATRGGDAITIDDDVLKNQNISFGQHYGPINTIVLSRSGESDNIYYPATLPENPIEFKIVDNQLMNENNREDFLQALYNQLNGVEYDIYDTELTGWGDVRPLQTVNFETGGNTYSSYIFNNEITLTDGYKQAIYNELPEETTTDYKAASTTDKAINQAYIIVRKNEAEIESLASRVVDVSDTKIGVGSITLENAYEGQLYQLSIKGQISLVFPQSEEGLYGYPLVPSDDLVPSNTLTPSMPVPYGNAILYPSSNLFTKNTNLIVDETKYKLDFNFLNYLSDSVCDEFIYDNGTCYIIRRVGIDENGNKYALDNEVIEPRESVLINVKSNSTISLESFDNAILKATYLLENEYTDNFATQVEVKSEIKQTADSINLEVAKKVDNDDYTGANIMLKVNEDSSSATINADKIDLNATDILNLLAGNSINLTSKNITLNSTNFKVDENGNMEANNGTLNNVNINGGSIEINNDAYLVQNAAFKIIDTQGNYFWASSRQAVMHWDSSEILLTKINYELGLDFTSGNKNLQLGTGVGIDYTIGVAVYFKLDPNDGHTYIADLEYDSISQASLEKLKKNINKFNLNALNLIKNSEVYEFNYKTENDDTKKHIGFVIGDGYNTPKEFISNDGNGIDTATVVGILVKAIQEQQVEIENLKKEMEELKNAKN